MSVSVGVAGPAANALDLVLQTCLASQTACLSSLDGALQRGEAAAKLAIADQDSPNIHIYDIRSGSEEPLEQIRPHRSSVEHMQYNAAHDVVISIDGKGEQMCAQLVLQQKRGGQAASAQK